MKPILSVIFVAVFCFVTNVAFAQQTTAEGQYYDDKIPTTPTTDSTPDVTQNVTNQDLQVGMHVLITKVDALAKQCTAPASPDCSQAIVAAEQKAQEVVKKDGLTPKEKRQVRRIVDEAILAASVGDIAGLKAIREQLADHEARIGKLEGDVAGLKTDVDALKSNGVPVQQSGEMTASDVNAYTEAQRNSIVAKSTAEQAKATAEEAKRLAEEAKAAAEAKTDDSGGVSQEALTAALQQVADAQAAADLAQRKADEAKARADEVAASGVNDPEADAEAKRLAEEAKTSSADALDKASRALAEVKGLQAQIDTLKGRVEKLERDLDKKQDANEVSIGVGYFSTPKIFAPTLVLKAALKRGKVSLGIGAEMGYHFFYKEVYYEPEVRILMNYDLGVSYQFIKWFAAGLGVFSYSAGQAYSDTFGFGLEAHTRFSWKVAEKIGMSAELWGGPCYNWYKESLPEPEGTLTTEVYRAVQTNSEISGAFGLRLNVDF